MTWKVHPHVILNRHTFDARRRLLLELRRMGVTTEQITEFSGGGGWWPSMRNEPVFERIKLQVEFQLVPHHTDAMWADTQILIRLPDEVDVPLGPGHTDILPSWASPDQWRYRSIFIVELADQAGKGGGGTVVFDRDQVVEPVLLAGDVLELSPDQEHGGSPNMRDRVRMALGFRLLERV